MSGKQHDGLRWLWLAPLVLSGVLGFLGWHKEQQGLEPALLTINVTIAIFAVNFSFLEYQFSPYRAVLRGVSPRQLGASVVVLVLAITPLVGLVAQRTWLPTIALIAIPIVASASVLLGMLARREASGLELLESKTAPKALDAFLEEFVPEVKAHLKELAALDLSKPAGMPTHEWEVRTSPPARIDDPFNLMASLGHIAVQNSDLHTFQRVVARSLAAALHTACWKGSAGDEDHRVRSVLARHAEEAIHRLGVASCELDKTETSAAKFLDACAAFVWGRSMEQDQTSELVAAVMFEMGAVAKWLLRKGGGATPPALIPVVVARQAAQKGIESGCADGIFGYSLGYLPRHVKELGREAIAVGDANYLYRCLDAFWWLGVAAVKADAVEVARECFGGLAQLGREARAANLECFWDRCGVRPYEHVNDHILSTAGCIVALEPGRRGKWLDLAAESLSRLHGKVCRLSIEEKEGTARVVYEPTKEPHKVLYSESGGERTIDYSDATMLKDLKLTGIPQDLMKSSVVAVVQGPAIRINTDE